MEVVQLIDSKHVEKNLKRCYWSPVDVKEQNNFVSVFLFYTRKPTEQSGII